MSYFQTVLLCGYVTIRWFGQEAQSQPIHTFALCAISAIPPRQSIKTHCMGYHWKPKSVPYSLIPNLTQFLVF